MSDSSSENPEPEGDQPPQLPDTTPRLPTPPPAGAPPEEIAAFFSTFYSGQVAPPNIAEGWARLVPDAPERLLRMTEDEAGHRHWMDRTFIWFRFSSLAIAAIFGMTALIGGIVLIATGANPYGLAVIISNLAVLLTVFLVRQFTMNGNSDGPTLP